MIQAQPVIGPRARGSIGENFIICRPCSNLEKSPTPHQKSSGTVQNVMFLLGLSRASVGQWIGHLQNTDMIARRMKRIKLINKGSLIKQGFDERIIKVSNSDPHPGSTLINAAREQSLLVYLDWMCRILNRASARLIPCTCMWSPQPEQSWPNLVNSLKVWRGCCWPNGPSSARSKKPLTAAKFSLGTGRAVTAWQ